MMNKQMMYIFPVLTIFVCMSLPPGLAFYWLLITLLTIIHQEILFKKKTKTITPQIIEGEIVKQEVVK
jgi:membrane protein insertase Oxa1/YidC/SpoIIIJ